MSRVWIDTLHRSKLVVDSARLIDYLAAIEYCLRQYPGCSTVRAETMSQYCC